MINQSTEDRGQQGMGRGTPVCDKEPSGLFHGVNMEHVEAEMMNAER